MSEPTDILGKIGKKVAEEIKSVKDSVTSISEVAGDLTIGGNLKVNGTTTSIHTKSLEVEDNIIELNRTSTGAKGSDVAGIAVNLGLSQVSSNELNYDNDDGAGNDRVWTPEGTGFVSDSFVSGGVTAKLYEKYQSNVSSSQFTLEFSSTADVYENNENKVILIDQSPNTPVSQQIGTYSATGAIRLTDGFAITLTQNGADWDVTLSYTATNSSLDDATILWNDTQAQKKWLFRQGVAVSTINANIEVPDKDGVKINNVSLGDYSTFETAFNAAIA
jgi:hypothetical protein